MRNEAIIRKMIAYVDKILKYCENVTYENFKSNMMLVEACVFNLSQLGELVAKLDDSYIAKYAQVPWKQMRGLRNRIVHDYEGVNLILVWEIITDDLPDLLQQLKMIGNNQE